MSFRRIAMTRWGLSPEGLVGEVLRAEIQTSTVRLNSAYQYRSAMCGGSAPGVVGRNHRLGRPSDGCAFNRRNKRKARAANRSTLTLKRKQIVDEAAGQSHWHRQRSVPEREPYRVSAVAQHSQHVPRKGQRTKSGLGRVPQLVVVKDLEVPAHRTGRVIHD